MFRTKKDLHDKYRPNSFIFSQIPISSVLPNSQITLKDLLKIDKDDLIISIISCLITILTWTSFAYFSGSFKTMFYFWDTCDSFLYSEISHSKNPNSDPFRKFNLKYSDVLSPLPVQRFILRLFLIISVGSYRLAQLLYTLFFSIFSCLVFKRLLLVYNLVKSPLYTTILFCLFPVRFVLYRSISTYDTLFLTLIFLSFISYRIGQQLFMLIFVVLACFTRFEGVILFLVYFLLFLINLDVKNLILTFGSAVGVVFLYKTNYPNYRNFIIPHCLISNRMQESFQLNPLFYYAQLRSSISYLRPIHALEMVYFPAFFGSVVLLFVNVPLSLFCLFYSLFVTCIKSRDLHRFAIPAHSIGILIGFDSFLSHKAIQFCIFCLIPFLFLAELYYCGNQITTKPLSPQLSSVLQ